MVSQNLDVLERCKWCHIIGNLTRGVSYMHDFTVGVHPRELELKNWKNPEKSDPEFHISETIVDRENLRAHLNVNPYAKVSIPLSEMSQVS